MKNQKITSDTKSPLGDRCPTSLQAMDTSEKLLSIFIVEHDVVYYGISLSQGGLSQLCPSQTLAHPQPTFCGDRRRNRKGTDAVQALLRISQNISDQPKTQHNTGFCEEN